MSGKCDYIRAFLPNEPVSDKSIYLQKLPHLTATRPRIATRLSCNLGFDPRSSTLLLNGVNIKPINLSKKIDSCSLEEKETFVVQIWANLCSCYGNDFYRFE
jgi:hypothetical protein